MEPDTDALSDVAGVNPSQTTDTSQMLDDSAAASADLDSSNDDSPQQNQSTPSPKPSDDTGDEKKKKDDYIQQLIDGADGSLDAGFEAGAAVGQAVATAAYGEEVGNALYNPGSALMDMMSTNSSDTNDGQKQVSDAANTMSNGSGGEVNGAAEDIVQEVAENPEMLAALA